MKSLNFALRVAISLVLMSLYPIGPRNCATACVSEPRSRLHLEGLHKDVLVRRDERAIPYIEAASEDDLYLAQGYIVARDRLWQMDLLRRTAAGELSEILGAALVEEDKRRRAFGFAALAEQELRRISPAVRATMEAYARGVNAFIGSLDEASLPPEFRLLHYRPRPWRPADCLIIGKLFAETLSTTWHTHMMCAAFSGLSPERLGELFPTASRFDLLLIGNDKPDKTAAANGTHPPNLVPGQVSLAGLDEIARITRTMRRSLERIGVYADDLAASNNWVVSGKHSVTGRPLLANDPHLQPSAPSIWYLLQLTGPNVHVAGASVPGFPGVLIGHNESIAWGITNVQADVQDVYLERFDSEKPNRYMTPQGLSEALIRHEPINVRRSVTDPTTERVDVEITLTRHGPIVFEKDGKRYSLSWTALDASANEVAVYYDINRARNWHEFRAALSGYTGFPLNFVYADAGNHIGFWAAGRYPIRRNGGRTSIYDGATDAGDWTGYIPFESLPHLYDPPSGIIVTANNRIVGADYPFYITDNWAAPFRARRIHDLLTSKARLSVADFNTIQGDVYSYPDALFTAEVWRLGSPLQAGSHEWSQLLADLNGGDAMMRSDSRQIAISAVMRDLFLQRIVAGVLGKELARNYSWSSASTFLLYVITNEPREWLPKEFDSYQALLLATYKDAQEFISKRVGTDRSRWTWGQLAQVYFQHPLANLPMIGTQFAIAPFPQNGGNHTINRGALVSQRFIADVSKWDNTRQGIPLGESGNPSSPHGQDQLESWRTVHPPVFPFERNSVVKATKEALILTAQ